MFEKDFRAFVDLLNPKLGFPFLIRLEIAVQSHLHTLFEDVLQAGSVRVGLRLVSLCSATLSRKQQQP